MQVGGINLANIKELLTVGKAPTDAALKPGETLQAKVVSASDSTAILNIAGTRISAATDMQLQPGQVISLMVVEAGPERVVLKQLAEEMRGPLPAKYTKDDLINYLLKGTGLPQGELKGAAELLKGNGINLGADVEIARALIEAVVSEGPSDSLDTGALATQLERLVVNDGEAGNVLERMRAVVEALTHEAQLAASLNGDEVATDNAKARLLELQHALGAVSHENNGREVAALKASIGRLLDIINAAELLNIPVRQGGRDLLYLPIPIQIGDRVTTAEIKIYQKDARSGGTEPASKAFSVGFALDMPSLGQTRARLEVAQGYVNFSLAVENAGALKGAGQLFDELTSSFEELGYTVGHVGAAELKDKPALSLIEEKLGVSQVGIDYKA